MEGSPPERDVLLATKLQVPRSRPGLVPRRRLADRLHPHPRPLIMTTLRDNRPVKADRSSCGFCEAGWG